MKQPSPGWRASRRRSLCPKYQEEKSASAAIVIRPRPTAETKNNTQRIGLYQSGCTRSGAIKKSDPSDDWCRVDKTIPRITSGIVASFQRSVDSPEKTAC